MKRPEATAIVVLLLLSALALALAPLKMDEGYSVIRHTTSESGGQGVHGAWVARTGFLLLGSTMVWLSISSRARWGIAGTILLCGFGLLMISAAAFSIRSWVETADYDRTEDLLHSIAAFTMSVAFILGVFMVSQARKPSLQARLFDLMVFFTAIGLSFAFLLWPGGRGLVQRFLLLIGYIWLLRETLNLPRQRSAGITSRGTVT